MYNMRLPLARMFVKNLRFTREDGSHTSHLSLHVALQAYRHGEYPGVWSYTTYRGDDKEYIPGVADVWVALLHLSLVLARTKEALLRWKGRAAAAALRRAWRVQRGLPLVSLSIRVDSLLCATSTINVFH